MPARSAVPRAAFGRAAAILRRRRDLRAGTIARVLAPHVPFALARLLAAALLFAGALDGSHSSRGWVARSCRKCPSGASSNLALGVAQILPTPQGLRRGLRDRDAGDGRRERPTRRLRHRPVIQQAGRVGTRMTTGPGRQDAPSAVAALAPHRRLSPRRRLVDPWFRRCLLVVLALVVAAALADSFGQRPVASRAASGAAELGVQSPQNLRGGLIFQARFTITARRALHTAHARARRGLVRVDVGQLDRARPTVR